MKTHQKKIHSLSPLVHLFSILGIYFYTLTVVAVDEPEALSERIYTSGIFFEVAVVVVFIVGVVYVAYQFVRYLLLADPGDATKKIQRTIIACIVLIILYGIFAYLRSIAGIQSQDATTISLPSIIG